MNLFAFLAFATWHIAGGNCAINANAAFRDDREIEADAIRAIYENEIDFSAAFFKNCAATKAKSFAVSPALFFITLAQLYSVAKGPISKQLSGYLHYAPDSSFARLGLEDLVYQVDELRDHGARMKNAIFHAYESGLDKSFEKKLNIIFRSVPQQAGSWNDIGNGVAIHEWSREVEIPYDIALFDAEDSLVFVSLSTFTTEFDADELNACYMKSVFHYNENVDHPGYDFVRLTAELNYGEFTYRQNSDKKNVTAQCLELSWPQDKMKLIIILPSEGNCITELEQAIETIPLEDIMSNMSQHNVIATLPRLIRIVTAMDLTTVLENMQLREVFEFAKNGTTKGNRFLHQVHTLQEFVNVFNPCMDSNDSPRADSSSEERKIFNADRAFVFLNVYNDVNRLILSSGRSGWKQGVGVDYVSD